MASLEHTANILRCFTTGRSELTVTEAARLLVLPKSTLSRLLMAMRHAGLLDVVGGGRGYRLGVLMHELGEAVRQTQTLSARASAAVRRLSDSLGHTGYVSALVGRDMVGLVHHVGQNPVQVGVPLGSRLPVDACATGRSLLAELSDDEVRSLLGGQVSMASPQSPQSFDELLQRLAQVRENGFAEASNETGKGVGALAVAVQDSHTGQRLSLCITFPISTMDKRERGKAIELLRQEQKNLMRNTE